MRTRVVWLGSLAFLVLGTGLVSAQDKKALVSSEYYPLEVNARWEYVTTAGKKITTQVVKHEEIGGVMCARIEATLANNKKSSEYIRATKEGVFRHQASDQAISPPLRFLKLPFEEGQTWKVESKTLGLAITGTFAVEKGTVTVLGKEYKDVLICKSTDFTIAGKKIPHTYWFAKNIGMVKQVVNFGGQEMKLELKEYTPGTK